MEIERTLFPTRDGRNIKLEVGQYVLHKNRFGNNEPHRIIAIKQDGFETSEYACMYWHTQEYPFESISEIIHEGAILDKRSYEPVDELQADIHKEMILRVDASMVIKEIKIGDRVGYKENLDSGKVVNTYTVQTRNMGRVKMYIVLHNNDMKRHHFRSELF